MLLVWLVRPGPAGVPATGGLMNRQPRASWLIGIGIGVAGLATWWILTRSKPKTRERAKVILPITLGIVLVVSVVGGIFWPGGLLRHDVAPQAEPTADHHAHDDHAGGRDHDGPVGDHHHCTGGDHDGRADHHRRCEREHHHVREPVTVNERLRARFAAEHPFPLDDFQRAALDALDDGALRARRRAHRRGQDAGRRVRDRGRARTGRQDLLHDAAEGPLEPEVRRLRPPLRRRARRASSPATT